MITHIDILRHPEWAKLENIGGHKKYHLEGNARNHSLLVFERMREQCFDLNRVDVDIAEFMSTTALLHDIGKIYTSIQHGPDDWEYPDHALCGSFRGILSKFVPEDDPNFKAYQWFIKNHIKPLFWKGKDLNAEFDRILRDAPDNRCNIQNLATLALCDVLGSKSVEPQDELIAFLTEIINK